MKGAGAFVEDKNPDGWKYLAADVIALAVEDMKGKDVLLGADAICFLADDTRGSYWLGMLDVDFEGLDLIQREMNMKRSRYSRREVLGFLAGLDAQQIRLFGRLLPVLMELLRRKILELDTRRENERIVANVSKTA